MSLADSPSQGRTGRIIREIRKQLKRGDLLSRLSVEKEDCQGIESSVTFPSVDPLRKFRKGHLA
jgi:hypothetical protein